MLRRFSQLTRFGRSYDPYAVLGVSRTASAHEIKEAFIKKAPTLHPDRNNSPNASIKFQELMEAYRVLRDEELRSAYDRKVPSESPRPARHYQTYSGFQRPPLRPPHPILPLMVLMFFVFLGERNRRVMYEEISDHPPSEIRTSQGHFVRAYRNPYTLRWQRLPAGLDPPPVALMTGYSEETHRPVVVGYVPIGLAESE